MTTQSVAPVMTRQGIQSILRKAGFSSCARLKGGRWRSGYVVEALSGGPDLWQIHYHHAHPRNTASVRTDRQHMAVQYKAALEAAGLVCSFHSIIDPSTAVRVRP
jgi:hypothetical protein